MALQLRVGAGAAHTQQPLRHRHRHRQGMMIEVQVRGSSSPDATCRPWESSACGAGSRAGQQDATWRLCETRACSPGPRRREQDGQWHHCERPSAARDYGGGVSCRPSAGLEARLCPTPVQPARAKWGNAGAQRGSAGNPAQWGNAGQGMGRATLGNPGQPAGSQCGSAVQGLGRAMRGNSVQPARAKWGNAGPPTEVTWGNAVAVRRPGAPHTRGARLRSPMDDMKRARGERSCYGTRTGSAWERSQIVGVAFAASRPEETASEAGTQHADPQLHRREEASTGEGGSAQPRSEAARPPTSYERLFSNVNQATLKHEPGSLTSSILLVAGTTVGAGILALPAVTQEPGFLASTVTCTMCWLYMVTTGLLVAEVNVNTMCELGSGGVSLVSMAERTLGKVGVGASCFAYVFIHYALLVAYVARSADIIATSSGLPEWASAAVFSLSLGSLCLFGSQRVVGAANGALVVGVIASFLFLLLVASDGIALEPLLKADFAAVPASIPIIALSFVYQNVVPVVSTNLEGDLPRIRTAIVAGTAIPLGMFLAWNAVILGSLPAAGGGVTSAGVDPAALVQQDPLNRLMEAGGLVGATVQTFSFFAITTSYIGFVLGLTDFIADLLKLPADRSLPSQLLPYALTIAPPAVLALLNPDIFFQALDVAGTYGVLVLFGIIPAAMAWSERYSDHVARPITQPLVPGGRITLGIIFGGAGAVILNEALTSFSQ